MGRHQEDASDASLVVAIARSRPDALAEEVFQEVLLRLWTQPEKFDPERGSLRSYLLTQTHGRAVDLLRSAEDAVERAVLMGMASPAANKLELRSFDGSASALVAVLPDGRGYALIDGLPSGFAVTQEQAPGVAASTNAPVLIGWISQS